jgi:tagatose 1,6-diphosphate aldolase GatY/KbaY
MAKRDQLLKVFRNAQREHCPIFQFNFSTLEQLQGIVRGVKHFSCPVILGTSEGESKFLGLDLAVKVKKIAEKEIGKGRVFLNLDHGKSFEIIKEAIKAGYDMVHFDGGGLPFKKNIEITKKVVAYGKKKDVVVEGELGLISQSSEVHQGKPKIKLEDLTNPGEAVEFVQKTGVDALAVAIGNIHGTYKKGREKLDLKRLSMIQRKVGDRVYLVLHGGSGIPMNQLKEAIKRGIVKININTETRVSWRKALEKNFQNYPDEVAPYKLMDGVIRAVQKVVEKKLQLFY